MHVSSLPLKTTSPPLLFQNFQFEFQETPEILFDKVIEIKVSSTVFMMFFFPFLFLTAVAWWPPVHVTSSQVFHRRLLAFMMTHIGTFKIDISTVFNQPGTRTAHTAAPIPTLQGTHWPPTPLPPLQTTGSTRSGPLSRTRKTPGRGSRVTSRPASLCWWRETPWS